MPRKAEPVIRAFEDTTLRIAVTDILPMREVRRFARYLVLEPGSEARSSA